MKSIMRWNRLVIVVGLSIALLGISAHSAASAVIAVVMMSRSELSAPSATVAAQANGCWSPTGELNTGRYHHTATLLPDGKVLVAGGASQGSCCTPTSTAELYDPISGTWSATGNLNTARSSHTATLLQNGEVLVAGGYVPQASLNSAELYDPVTGMWRLTSSFNTIRENISATLLPNGKVLAVGASDQTGIVSAELYDPATGTWSSTAAPTRGGRMVVLPNGKVLTVFEGSPWDYGVLDAEVYDPATGQWSSAGYSSMFWAQEVTLLGNGKVLVTGRAGANYPTLAELYDTYTGTWSLTGNLSTSRYGYTATLLASGQVLVAGGTAYPSAEELYDATTGTWSLTSGLIRGRNSHTATLLRNGKVLVAGGVDGVSVSSAELYDPDIVPKIISASVEGKRLLLVGESFDLGAVILHNGEDQNTKNDPQNPHTSLIGKKTGKKVKPGDTLQVRNFDGRLSQEFIFTGS